MPVQLTEWFRQPVMHPQPILTAEDQPPFPEIRQMPGNGGLRQVQSFVQMADAHFAIPQQVQKP